MILSSDIEDIEELIEEIGHGVERLAAQRGEHPRHFRSRRTS